MNNKPVPDQDVTEMEEDAAETTDEMQEDSPGLEDFDIAAARKRTEEYADLLDTLIAGCTTEIQGLSAMLNNEATTLEELTCKLGEILILAMMLEHIANHDFNLDVLDDEVDEADDADNNDGANGGVGSHAGSAGDA